MEAFKIEIWEKDNLNLEYKPLNKAQIQETMNDISKKYCIPISFFDNSLLFEKVPEILKKEFVLLEINEQIGFEALISKLKIEIPQNSDIDIIWNCSSIDRIKGCILKEFWDYIWYGASDEACLLWFPNGQILVMITDYGTIYTY